MTQKTLFALWGGLFILCAGLGFIPEPSGVLRSTLTVLSVAFFIPPGVLLQRAGKAGDRNTVKLVRNFAAMSLVLTLVLLIGNFLSAMTAGILGTVLYYVLVIVSSPMVCSGYWVLSLFLWACLLMVSLRELKQ